jgi:hypothetical protein
MDHLALERIRLVTRHFAELQGLRATVPIGLFLFGYGLLPFCRGSFGYFLVTLSIEVLGFVLYWKLPSYYRRQFGEVENLGGSAALASFAGVISHATYFGGVQGPRQWHRPRWPRLPGWGVGRDQGVWWSPMYGTIFLASWKDLGGVSPARMVQVLCIFHAALLLWRWARLQRVPGQLYYPLLGSLLLLLAAFPGAVTGGVPAWGVWGRAVALVGGVWMLVGLLDHRSLALALGSLGPLGSPGALEAPGSPSRGDARETLEGGAATLPAGTGRTR